MATIYTRKNAPSVTPDPTSAPEPTLDPEIVIDEEDVALADVPVTGDLGGLYVALVLLFGGSLKKKED